MTDTPLEPRIEAIDIEEEVKRSYLDYAMSVIVGRALPDVRDGLKPVHRRILHAMNGMGVRPGTPFKKSARVVGECFVEGALVHTPTGLRPIQELEVGDEVLDPAGTPVRIVGCFANPPGEVVDVVFAGGRTLRVTPGQLFRVLNDDRTIEWVRADGLNGKSVLSFAPSLPLNARDSEKIDGLGFATTDRVEAIRNVSEKVETFDVQIAASDHAFVVEGMVVHNCMGKFHPHGDQAIYDALARMAQDFAMRAPLIQGHGNFGSVDGDPPAAQRYTECRLAPLAMEMLRDIGEETVDFIPNYDGEEEEPVVLPARFPNLLVNGSTGIAVGMATNIPPHNLGEVVDATLYLIDNPEASAEDLMKFVKGPDFPTGGIIMGRAGLRQALETGRGSVKVRGKAEIEEGKNGRQRIIITELPYMVSGDRVLSKIAEMVEKKVITGIATTRDSLKNESNRHGLRLVVELKRDAIPQVVLNNLYKHTQLQDSFGVNMLALVDGVPRTLGLVDVLTAYVGHQVEVVTRRTRYRLRKAEERAHILEGLLVALNHLDDVIALIRASSDVDAARTGLMERFDLSEIQANAILDMQLRRLAALERQKIIDEHTELQAQIADYKDILAKPERVRAIIKEEMSEIRAKFADKRRTAVQADEGDMDLEDLIPDEECVITITRSGYIKRVNLSVYRTQGRGGKGVRGAKPKEGDIVEHLLTTTSHAYVLFFSSLGKVYRIKAHEIPEKDRTARGISIRNLLPLSGEDAIAAIIDTRDYETHKYLVIATSKGIIKRTEFSAYDSSRRDGIIALSLRDGDAVVQVRATSGEDELILATRKGQSIVFPESEVRAMGRTASGVIGVKVKPEDEVMAFEVVDPNGEFLIVTDNGYGKRTLMTNYPRQHRGGSGVRTVQLTARKGFVAGAMVVRPGHELFLISSSGQVIRIQAKEIRRTGRDAQGVRVMRLAAGETVAAMAPVIAEEEDGS